PSEASCSRPPPASRTRAPAQAPRRRPIGAAAACLTPWRRCSRGAWRPTSWRNRRSTSAGSPRWPSRAVTLAVPLVVAAAAPGRRARAGRPARATAPPAALALPALAGLLDVLAFLAFARAGQVGPVSVAAAASACFPLIVIAGRVLVFRERLRTVQFVGAGLTIAGLLVLGLRP